MAEQSRQARSRASRAKVEWAQSGHRSRWHRQGVAQRGCCRSAATPGKSCSHPSSGWMAAARSTAPTVEVGRVARPAISAALVRCGFTTNDRFLDLSRTGSPGHNRSPPRRENLRANDRSQSTADIAGDPSTATKSPLRSFGAVGAPTRYGPWSYVCSRRDRAGAHDPEPTSADQISSPRSRRSDRTQAPGVGPAPEGTLRQAAQRAIEAQRRA